MNQIEWLSSAIWRRFNLGVFFFDLPTPKERDVIWEIYLKKYGHQRTNLPNDNGWTGAEIKNFCQLAYKLGLTLEEGAKFVVPVAVTAEEEIRKLRENANNRRVSRHPTA